MNLTRIDYLDCTWSPLIGCTGKNCTVYTKCWAKAQAKRRQHLCSGCYTFTPHTHFERLEQPLKVKKTKRIGVTFSADMFDEKYTRIQQEAVIDVAFRAPWHVFFNLTKQPQNIPFNLKFPDNWVQGTSICTRKDLERMHALFGCRARWLALSIEPLYEDLGDLPSIEDIDWVIIGAQTRPLKLPKREWVDSIIEQCLSHGVPVFTKNNLKDLGYKHRMLPPILAPETIKDFTHQ